jgi:hypothetical protein
MIALTGSWFFWAVLSTFCMAVIAHFNHRRRLDPQLLNAWHSTLAAVILLAAFPFMIWPEWDAHKKFYLVAVAGGFIMAFGMVFFFWLSLRRTGRVTSMIIPLAAVGAYATWWLLAPDSRPRLLEHPFKVYLSVLSILVVCFAIQKVRANDASWETFIFILPIGLVFGARDAFVKWVVGSEMHIYATAITFTSISVSVAALMAWIAAMPRPPGGRKTRFFEPSLLWGSFWCAFWTVGMLLSGIIALIRAPNPAYPGIVMALTPLWLYAYNYLRGETDEGSPVAGAFIMLGAVGLLLSTL